MPNLSDTPAWPGVRQIDLVDLVIGGPGGIDNIAPGQLAQRTSFLSRVLALHAVTKWKACAPLLLDDPPTTPIVDTLVDAAVIPAGDSPTDFDLIVAIGATSQGAVRGPQAHALPAGPLWTVHDIDTVDSRTPLSIAYANGTLVVVGAAALIATSVDGGATWTIRSASDTYNLGRVIYVAALERWVAVGQTGEVAYSDDDGVTWTVDTIAVHGLLDVACDPVTGRLLAVGSNTAEDAGVAAWSDDAETWTIEEIGAAHAYTVAHGNGWWVVGGPSGSLRFFNLPDGIGWRTVSSTGAVTPTRIVWFAEASAWIATSFFDPHTILVISGADIRRVEVAPGIELRALTLGARGQLVAVGDDCAIYESACAPSAARVHADATTGFVVVEALPWL